jgi:hypothetical protein
MQLCLWQAARLRSASYGAAAFADFATKGRAGLPSRSWRSLRRLVRGERFELVTVLILSQAPPASWANRALELSTGYDPVFPPYQSGVLPNERRER